jgi:hypothetical protein
MNLQSPRFLLQGLSLITVAVVSSASPVTADERPVVEPFLMEGQLDEGARALSQHLERNPDDQSARFTLGMVHFFQALEGLGQDQYRYGLLGGRARALPFMRLPIPENPEPEQISYVKARGIISAFLDRLQKAEQTLSSIDAEGVVVPLRLGQVRLDLNGDGETPNEESVWHITQVLQNPRLSNENAKVRDFQIVFDAGDVAWLQGYCHALSAVGEIVLAHDWQDQFERTAHLFYPRVDTPYEFLLAEGTGAFFSFGAQNALDLLAWVHTINYEVTEPERMRKALMHLESMIQLSRVSWKFIEQEQDDNREWVPNARQTSVMRGFTVTGNVVEGWREFLDEMDLILKGRRLVPFWRGIKGGISPFATEVPVNPEIGINVRRVFTEPTRLDLALWVQGTAALPYLERGEITSPRKWNRMMGQFGGRFFNFALWFN